MNRAIHKKEEHKSHNSGSKPWEGASDISKLDSALVTSLLLLVAHQLGRAYTAQQCEWMEIPMKTSVKNLFWYDEKNSLNSNSAQKNDKVIELWGDFVIFNWSLSDQTSFKGKKNFVKLSYDKCKLFSTKTIRLLFDDKWGLKDTAQNSSFTFISRQNFSSGMFI